MRWLHLTVIAVFAFVMIVFSVQNFQSITMAFLGFSVRAPFAVIVILIYVLGMVTGGSLLSLLRHAIEGSRRHAEKHPD